MVVPFAAFAQDGTLDTGFGTSGLVYTPFASGSYDEAHAVAIQKDGRIIAAGKSQGKFAAARYWSNGAIDSTFGTAGKVTTDMYGGNGAYAALVQTDGKIVIVGTGYVGQFGIVRYDTTGALDLTFAGSGWNMVGVGDPCYAYGAALQPDGKILVAGRVARGGNDNIMVMRFNTNGSLDAAFGSSGIVETEFGGNEEAYGVALQSNGKIVVVGSNYNADFLVVRYKSNGTIDSTFGTNGKVLTPVGSSYDNAYSVAIQADGKIVVGGYATFTYSQFAVVRYDTSGVLDPTFNSTGIASTWFGYGHDIPYSVAIQSNGKIVAAGTVTNVSGEYDFGVVRYNSNGTYDNTFGSSGLVRTDPGSVLDYGNAMAIAPNGKIVVAGQSLVPTGRYSFAVAQYLGSSGPLPVELTSFSASVRGNGVELFWETATESNNYGFEIERLQIRNLNFEIRNWSQVGFIAGSGTTTSPRQYSFDDNNVVAGRYSYRIKQIDKDGSFKYTQTAEVEVGLVPKEFTLGQNYPNPFNPSTTIEFTLPQDGRATLKVYNVLGQAVATLFDDRAEAGRIYHAQFDAAWFTSGVYVSVLESGGKRLLRKMVLVK
jgi:uncharacterized delta-60 repeat protein